MSATRHNHYERLIAHARTLPALPCAVAHPCDETSLGAALQAMQLGLLTPILVGPQQKIRDVAERCGLDLGGAAIVDAPHSHAAAAAAVQLVRGGQASLLMKGSLHTDELMHEVVARDTGLRTERRISHVFIMDVPTYPEPLFITDAAINIFPDLETKADIVRNAIALHLGLGLGEPRVAILSAVEQVMPSIPSTLEAAALCKMADRGQIQGGILDGPLALDNAISPEAAQVKGIVSPVAGRAQVLVVPDLEAGNMLAKNLSFLANAQAAGIVLGARVPIVLTSRADSAQTRLASCAVATLYAHHLARATPWPDATPTEYATMSDNLLVINAGSSSLKFYLYEIAEGDELRPTLGGQLDGIGGSRPHLRIRAQDGHTLLERDVAPTHAADVPGAQEVLGTWLSGHLGGAPCAIGHRVVHGGTQYDAPVLVDDDVLAQLDDLTPLAPLHQPNNLAPIRVIRERRPNIPQVACFDTAFHRTHSPLADRYALPEHLYQEGVRRYGFHGLSYEYIARSRRALPEIAGGKIVAAHLGNGVSACTMVDGRSVDSTMGFTALEGLPMGTRPGRLDPGVVLWMMERGMSHDDIEHLLYHDCGLKGLSGIGNDVRELLASDAPAARLALDYFAWRVAEGIAGLGCAMNGIDAIVFTAGIGENAAPVRAAIARHWEWLGVRLDEARNARHGPRISSDDSAIGVYVVRTNEELIIAQHTLALVRQRQA